MRALTLASILAIFSTTTARADLPHVGILSLEPGFAQAVGKAIEKHGYVASSDLERRGYKIFVSLAASEADHPNGTLFVRAGAVMISTSYRCTEEFTLDIDAVQSSGLRIDGNRDVATKDFRSGAQETAAELAVKLISQQAWRAAPEKCGKLLKAVNARAVDAAKTQAKAQ